MCVILTIKDRIKIPEKLEAGVSITKSTEESDIGKQILSDIKWKRRNKKFPFQFNSDGGASSQNITKMPFHEDMKEVVHKESMQQNSSSGTMGCCRRLSSGLKITNSTAKKVKCLTLPYNVTNFIHSMDQGNTMAYMRLQRWKLEDLIFHGKFPKIFSDDQPHQI